jgi:hypothetical protein
MISKDMMDLIIQVIKSWQVIAVTITIVLYIFLVNYVARLYHRPRSVSKSKPQKAKVTKAPKEAAKKQDGNAELGLVEEE